MPGCPGIAGGFCGFSRNPVTGRCSSTATMPKRGPSSIGTSIAASVTSAAMSWWNRSIFW